MAQIVNYDDYDRHAIISCPSCDWSGPSADHEDYFEQLLDVTCPSCDTMLLIVSYPTPDETQAAAPAGNQEAVPEIAKQEDQGRT